MAEIYQALQRTDQRYDMTCGSDEIRDSSRPIGYCAGWDERAPSERLGESITRMILDDREKRRPHQAKYHTGGHETPGEALTCWRGYLIDNHLRFFNDPDTLKRCASCSSWTDGRAELAGYSFGQVGVACTLHQTPEGARAALWPEKATT